ncbi:DUF7619 domain-containing protein [Hymenobacter profundi]|uniref:IPT/TIG domain-containing protein n=1 Tax=Hymenobacter profundi TaxID=1982110 RepID=A0ABS6WVY5_9BACT|nr:IPT/TIG domain-containing protein [Hymenobacter profundi]MBW3127773.1 IPT/TIG domain-containing protein [Hymenobacter profundi]
MKAFLHWLCLFLFPLSSLAQVTSDFTLRNLLWTPLNKPQDVSVDDQGRMYVLDSGYITQLDSQGVYSRRIALTSPDPAKTGSTGTALALDGAGNFYVGDRKYGEVRKFSPDGHLLLAFGQVGQGPGQIEQLQRIAVDMTGNIYVVDKRRVLKFDARGQQQWQYIPSGLHYGMAVRPVDVEPGVDGSLFVIQDNFALLQLDPTTGDSLQTILSSRMGNTYDGTLVRDAQGNIYTRNPNSGPVPIYKYSSEGRYLGSIGSGMFNYSSPTALAVDRRGNLYATNHPEPLSNTNKLYKFNAAGEQVGQWGRSTNIESIVFDRVGNLCVADKQGRQILKYDANGRELFRFGKYGTQPGTFGQISGLALDAQDNIYVLESKDQAIRIQKFTARGQFLKVIEVAHPNGNSTWLPSMAVDPVGCLYVVDVWRESVIKLDPQGQKLAEFGGPGNQTVHFQRPWQVAVDGRGGVYVADRAGRRVQKLSSTGQLLRQNETGGTGMDRGEANVGLSVDAAGTVFLSNAVDNQVVMFDPAGKLVRTIPGTFDYLGRVAVNRQGTRLLQLEMYSDLVSSYEAPALPGKGEVRVQGRIFQDLNQDCVAQPEEPGLAGIAVVAEPGSYYGISDDDGFYTIATDTGTYTVHQLLPTEVGRTLQLSCVTAGAVRIPAYGTTAPGPNFGNLVSLTPHLTVQVASNRRRRCFRNLTTVTYANTGFAAAADAKVRVELPAHVLFVSADVPHTRTAQGYYEFAVGTLQPNQRGTITIQDSVACDNPDIRGLTVCTKAWITPRNTYSPPTLWNEASMMVGGALQADQQTRFVVQNTGRGATTDSLYLRVYQDTELALRHPYRLAAGDSLVLRVPATGQVVRVEADQPTGHPFATTASAYVELPSPAGSPSAAVLAFPPNDEGPEKAQDCQPIVDSFDPNDKQVVPAGLTAQHYTPTNTALRYQVRFQNTGTDVAYRVVVVDTLATELDLSTLQVGAASHSYRLSVSGKTHPVLTFTFDNILLPDSSHDQVGSNGFVCFSLRPKAGLAPKTRINNFADIFFDYNEPVRTNTTLNRIYDIPPTIASAAQLQAQEVIVSPSIRSFSPAQGRVGALVTLQGSHFSSRLADNQVLFQGIPAAVLRATATSLTVRVPPGATTGTVQVITSDGAGRSAQKFTVYQPPLLHAVVPAEGKPGSTLTLTGEHFSPVAAHDTVWFNGVLAPILHATTTSLQVTVPTGATTGKVRVAALGGQAETAQAYVIWHPPTITAFSPVRGKAGTMVTLVGNHLGSAARTRVDFGGREAQLVQATPTQLLVRVPTDAETGLLRVQTPGGSDTAGTAFTFLPAPVITSFAPIQGSVGELVTLTGKNFLVEGKPDTLLLGTHPVAVLATTATSAVIRVPKGARTAPFVIVGSGGSTRSNQPFTVLDLSPAEAITVYPNPAQRDVTLDWRKADFSLERVQVYNTLGSLIATVDLQAETGSRHQLHFADRQTGLYWLVIHTSRGLVTKRVMVY